MFKKFTDWCAKRKEANEAKLKELKAKPIGGINFKLHGVDFVVCGLDVISIMKYMRESSNKAISVKNKLDGKTHMIKPHYIKTYVDVTYYPETNTYR